MRLLALLLLLTPILVCAEQSLPQELKQNSTIRKHVCLLIGLNDPETLVALPKLEEIQILIGVDEHAERVAQARDRWQKHYGKHSAQVVSYEDLPFTNDVINTIIIPDYKQAQKDGLSLDEAKRVLAPFGSLIIAGAIADAQQMKINGKSWSVLTKTLPADVDEWTHYRYDASASSVSKDQRVGPVNGIKWIQGKTWSASFGGAHSILSANGRNFYIRDGEAIKKEQGCQIEVRDAFNGSPLWVAPVFYKRARGWVYAPQVIVTDNYVIAKKAEAGPLVIRHAEDGSVYKEIAILSNSSFNVSNDIIFYCDESGTGVRRYDLKHKKELAVLPIEDLKAETMFLVHDDQLFASVGEQNKELLCYDLKSNKEKWHVENKGDATLYWVRKNTLLLMQKTKAHKGGVDLHGFDASNGKFLWTHQSTTKKGSHPSALFVGDIIWAYQQERWFTGVNPQTGKRVKGDRGRAKEFGRCGFDHATEQYILGMDFSVYDMDKITTFDCFIARADCGVGYIPANGLVYQYGNQCRCGSYVTGVLALHSERVPDYKLRTQADLIKGPAFDSTFEDLVQTGDWTTLRGSQKRSAATPMETKATWKSKWHKSIGGKVSPAVIVNKHLYIADVDAHTVKSLGLKDGSEAWSFTADARVDSPPTIYKGRAVFGSRDGTLYCLHAQTGALAWKFKAAPASRMISVRGQFESLWMLYGAVAIQDDIAYAVAGRHGDADGGLFAYGINVISGELVWSERIQGFPPFRTDPHKRLIEARKEIPKIYTEESIKEVNERFLSGIGYSINNDVPIIEEDQLIIGTIAVNIRTKEKNVPSGQSIYTNGLGLLVDNTNPEFTDRNRWIFTGLNEGRSWRTPRAPDIMANVIAYDDDYIVAVNHNLDRTKTMGTARVYGYPNPISQGKKGMDSKLAGLKKTWNKSFRNNNDRLKALLVSKNHVFVASDKGGLSINADLSKRSGRISVHDKNTGQILNYLNLPEAPAFDGLAICQGALVVTLMDGSIICFEESDSFAADVPKDQVKTYASLRINCGSLQDYTDKAGNVWKADQEFEPGDWGYIDGGIVTRKTRDIANTQDDDIYLNEHYGMSAYRIPVKNGSYTVTLHFAETWRGNTAPGKRVFSTLVEGEVVSKDLDVFKETGAVFAAYNSNHGVTVKDGELTITFDGKGFMINGIEIQKK